MNEKYYISEQLQSQRFRIVGAPEASSAADYAWFATNPDRQYRARLAHEAELREIRRCGHELPAGPVVVVACHLPSGGLLLYEVGPHEPARRDPATLDEAGAKALFWLFAGHIQGSA